MGVGMGSKLGGVTLGALQPCNGGEGVSLEGVDPPQSLRRWSQAVPALGLALGCIPPLPPNPSPFRNQPPGR